MNILADEGVDQQIVHRLRLEGHNVTSIAEMQAGISDTAVLETANREGALLMTADKDFGELIFRQNRVTGGVLLLRLAGLSQNRKVEIVASALRKHAQRLPGSFTVIAPGSIRVRKFVTG